MKKHYPIYLDLTDRLCLVVGGGEIAYHKAIALLESGARLRIVATEIREEIQKEFTGSHEILETEFSPAHIDGCHLVIAATDDQQLNKRISNEARKAGVFVNAVDQPDECDFYVPAILARDGISIAISTGGKSPAFAGWLKRELDNMLNPKLGDALEIISAARSVLIKADPQGFHIRSKAFKQFFQSDIWHEYLKDDGELTEETVIQWISSYSE